MLEITDVIPVAVTSASSVYLPDDDVDGAEDLMASATVPPTVISFSAES
jgi:hypothetical protein